MFRSFRFLNSGMSRTVILLVCVISACNSDRKPFSVLVFMSTECPLCAAETLTLVQLKKDFGAQVDFVAVFPNPDDTKERIAGFKARYEFDFPVQLDPDHKTRDRFAATVTPQVFLIDQKGRKIYDGQINNRMISVGKKRKVVTEHYLQDAIVEAIGGGPITLSSTEPIGCSIFSEVTICRN